MPRGLSDYDSAVIQGRLWTPEVLRPDAWFDAADLSTITIATGVSEWRDKSGNARHASQATTGNQPAYSEFSFSGRPGLTFDGTSDFLSMTAWPQVNGHNVFCVADTTLIGTGARIFINRSTGSAPFPPAAYFGLVGNDRKPSIFWGSSSPSADLAIQASAVQRAAVFRWNISTGTASTEVDGSNLSSSSHAQTVLTNWTSIGSNFGSQHPAIVLSEFLVVTSPGVAEAAAIHGYLSWKWGIRLAADHPYANRPPLIGD
ncbi:MAG: hypothetical protein ACK5ZS_00835 [bacterium]|jgi:hypothetical protein